MILGVIPWDTKLLRDVVNVIEIAGKEAIFHGERGTIGEVTTGKLAVFVKLFEGAILEDMAAVPDVATMLVNSPIHNISSPFTTSCVVFIQVLAWYANEEVIINPPQDGADSL